MSEENPSYRAAFIIIAAIVIFVAVVGGYVWFNRVPPLYAGQVLSMNVYPIHRDFSQKTTTEGIGGVNEVYDEILVLANVRITNTGKIPLFLHDMWAEANLPDESDRSTAASSQDFNNVFIAYPDLKQFQKTPLPRDLTLQPRQQAEGMLIFNYNISKEQWDSRSSMDINISFLHHPPLVLNIAK